MSEKISILGVNVDKITLKDAEERVKSFLNSNTINTIYTPNTEIVMEARNNQELKSLLNKGDLVIPDGIGLVYASKIKKKPLLERVAGSDLSMRILDIANDEGHSIFILGGKPGVAQIATENIKKKYPNIDIAGYHHGYFKGTHIGHKNHEEENEVINIINKAKPDIVFVGLGAPKQEQWIDENKEKLNCKVIIGNGGTVDIIAGTVKRAPEVYQRLGLEWLYRLLKDPRRIKRQIVLPKFVLIVLFSKDEIVK
ncbi:N-acetylglucosaminyldiphosphoundecaprenol N-acetyl-beta-D-mannosaminyltransferase [Proteiniborus ethanoligenes]|uniref:N-acetylglucosaminyldiphosphoundecaprenol N-acetyl-beta-D-mannosaminyltransferase n=1 Tax=Proteiniborus ethanoligenes TaxID=415015 RepID=A0A1H3SFS8_9FIRM|nr:WecB/TagA/CpsF family glycosyltransferase [Proteiniborus ethanoligenes]SDZ36597.1 N-acetylglucosaminyldiphosphoundecaprenol N-acetyl-beta-D-mannosaminyltransferase [Proteiniborus ethanoligenes]